MASKKTTHTLHAGVSAVKQVVFALALAFIVAGSIYVLSSMAAKLFYEMPRTARVREIYASLNLSDQYIHEGGTIIGGQRLYREDGTRSWSSYQYYQRGAAVDVTVDDLTQRIQQAGFSVIDESSETSTIAMRQYKNDRGEYIKLTAESKPRLEYYQNALMMGIDPVTTAANAIDPNTGPVKIMLKVNLDNNRQ